MTTTYKEGQVIQDDGVVRPEPVSDVLPPVTVEDATGTSAPEPVPSAAPERPVKKAAKPKTKTVPKAQHIVLGKHKR